MRKLSESAVDYKDIGLVTDCCTIYCWALMFSMSTSDISESCLTICNSCYLRSQSNMLRPTLMPSTRFSCQNSDVHGAHC